MRIAVFGVGGIGGYFGWRLARSGEDVVFVARGENLRVSLSTRAHRRYPGREVQPSSNKCCRRPQGSRAGGRHPPGSESLAGPGGR